MSDRRILYAAAFLRALGIPLVVGAGLKISYDVLLYCAFRRVRPPEEASSHGDSPSSGHSGPPQVI